MKITILGSQGFVGKNFIDYFDPKFNVISSDIYENGTGKNYTQVDITKFNDVKNVLKDTDCLINLVANTLIKSFEQTIENAQVNIIGMLNILESCRVNDVKKIIFPSASSMIGSTQINPVPEEHPAFPKTPYGVTKLASEHYLRLYQELHGINYVIFRFFNIYGPHQLNGLIPTLISRMQKNEPITIFGKGDQIRDYVFIKDVASYFERSVLSDIADNKTINMGTGKGSTILDVVNSLSEILNIEPKITYQPEKPGEISNFVANTSLLEQIFGSVPSTSLKDGLTQTVEWYKTIS